MKEYKVISWKIGLSGNNQKLEDTLNSFAKKGWKVINIAEQSTRIILERDKNR
ncbi:DUF4177 domain-containing protein [Tenacibaculum sp. C7A-26P2]|uniref:DUF4177 domain-containing protein n=1 Tax=Tenacibaculum sp. C7A-26P2 TaxID=3447504 RepID=UPI003F87AF93